MPFDFKATLAKHSHQSQPTQAELRTFSKSLDVAFIFDTTGSMYPYLERVRSELTKLANEICKSISNIRLGVIAYGDYCDASSTYVTKVLDLTPSFEQVQKFVEQVERTGGGDAPEAVEEALFAANGLTWRIGSRRVIILVGDAPPHGVSDDVSNCLYGHDYQTEGNILAQKGVKIYTAQCGRASDAEQAFRWLVNQTNGIYLNLENIGDLVDLLIGICMKEVGLLDSYTEKLQTGNILTDSKVRLFKQLKGSLNDQK
jgi:hypothetical protein